MTIWYTTDMPVGHESKIKQCRRSNKLVNHMDEFSRANLGSVAQRA